MLREGRLRPRCVEASIEIQSEQRRYRSEASSHKYSVSLPADKFGWLTAVYYDNGTYFKKHVWIMLQQMDVKQLTAFVVNEETEIVIWHAAWLADE